MSTSAERVSRARELAFATVRATFEEGAFTDRFFRRAADENGLAGRDRAQAQRLAYGAVQRRGTSDAAIELLAERSTRLLDPPVLAGLRIGLYELLFAEATPDHAAVDQAVELVKDAGAAHAAGLVNAVLRRAIRERKELAERLLGDDSTPERAATAHSVPVWLARLWWEELGGTDARSLLAASNEPAEAAVTVNTLRTSRDAAAATFREAGVETSRPDAPWPLSPEESLVVSGRSGAVVSRMAAEGLVTPQSRGSAAVVAVLDPQPGEHVLDFCAGPGIKTAQIAARMGDRGETISVELEPARAGEVADQARRMGLQSVSVIEADAGEMELPAGFDRVLVDAPCSDLGTLASRPDARWRKSPRMVERLVAAQRGILSRAAAAVRPGGFLVYATCTISRRENEEQVATLLDSEEGRGLAIEDLAARSPELAAKGDSRCLQVRPDRDGTSGFFICRLKRED